MSKKTIEQDDPKLLLIKQKEEERRILQDLILESTEAKLKDKGSDENLDRLNEIITLRNGNKRTIKSLRYIVSEKPVLCDPMFVDIYPPIWKLNGWPKPSDNYRHKPHSVADFTIQVIYGRFFKEVLPELRKLNPYIGYCIRQYKLYHFLTDEAREKLATFISEAVDMMNDCISKGLKMRDFRQKYAEKYGLPFQTSLFN